MKVVFVSNYYNHHQDPFSKAMTNMTHGAYHFIATEEMEAERRQMGWNCGTLPAYVICAYESENALTKAKMLIKEADVVIYGLNGWNNFRLIQQRLKNGKLTFRYSERIYKNEIKWYQLPVYSAKFWFTGGRYNSMYLLCASAYAATDYVKAGNYFGRTYKWGYFPKLKKYNMDDLLVRKMSASDIVGEQSPVLLLWVGRLIGWKHPEVAIELAAFLKEKKYRFKLNIIGNGEMEVRLKQMIVEMNLADCVELLGAMSPESVREHMEQADVFLFTSDFNEGWGAVLNEAMNSGCAVVASHAIGSVPFLINNGKNGLIYENGNLKDLARNVELLMKNPRKRHAMGKEAYKTVLNMWNAEVAAKRLMELSQALIENNVVPTYTDGPCSIAGAMRNDWYIKD